MNRAERIIEQTLDRIALYLSETQLNSTRRKSPHEIRAEISHISKDMKCQKKLKNGKKCSTILCPHHTNNPIIPVYNATEEKQLTEEELRDNILRTILNLPNI